ncbi:hypothetical protein BJV82DRAFT_673117 [Fennellomyces sp. T-0311]|nr:hypothetical protein BJV82DRAFT_673117 [Fennellomyces sp. T-0311]
MPPRPARPPYKPPSRVQTRSQAQRGKLLDQSQPRNDQEMVDPPARTSAPATIAAPLVSTPRSTNDSSLHTVEAQFLGSFSSPTDLLGHEALTTESPTQSTALSFSSSLSQPITQPTLQSFTHASLQPPSLTAQRIQQLAPQFVPRSTPQPATSNEHPQSSYSQQNTTQNMEQSSVQHHGYGVRIHVQPQGTAMNQAYDIQRPNVPNLTTQPLPAEHLRSHPHFAPTWPLTYHDLENGEQRFKRAVAQEIFLSDAFPETHAQATAVKILKQLHNIPPDDTNYRYTAHQDVVQQVATTASTTKTRCQTATKNFIDTYNFEFRFELPEQGVTTDIRKYMYHLLLEDRRFAKRDYDLNGALFMSKPIADCIRVVFRNPHSGRSRLDAVPRPIPPPLIALTYCLLFYRLAKGCEHERSRGNGKTFSRNSDWGKVYKHILDPDSEYGALVDWEAVQDYLQSVLPGDDRDADDGVFEPSHYF